MIEKERLMKLSIEELDNLIQQVQKMIKENQIEILKKEKKLRELQNNS